MASQSRAAARRRSVRRWLCATGLTVLSMQQTIYAQGLAAGARSTSRPPAQTAPAPISEALRSTSRPIEAVPAARTAPTRNMQPAAKSTPTRRRGLLNRFRRQPSPQPARQTAPAAKPATVRVAEDSSEKRPGFFGRLFGRNDNKGEKITTPAVPPPLPPNFGSTPQTAGTTPTTSTPPARVSAPVRPTPPTTSVSVASKTGGREGLTGGAAVKSRLPFAPVVQAFDAVEKQADLAGPRLTAGASLLGPQPTPQTIPTTEPETVIASTTPADSSDRVPVRSVSVSQKTAPQASPTPVSSGVSIFGPSRTIAQSQPQPEPLPQTAALPIEEADSPEMEVASVDPETITPPAFSPDAFDTNPETTPAPEPMPEPVPTVEADQDASAETTPMPIALPDPAPMLEPGEEDDTPAAPSDIDRSADREDVSQPEPDSPAAPEPAPIDVPSAAAIVNAPADDKSPEKQDEVASVDEDPFSKLTLPKDSPSVRDEKKAPKSEDEVTQKNKRIASRKGLKGLKGFCPVVLREQRDLVDTDIKYYAVYEEKTYFFSSSDARDKFQKSPESYAPVLSGHDFIKDQDDEAVEGSLDYAVWFRDRLYLFSGSDTLAMFVENPARFVDGESEADSSEQATEDNSADVEVEAAAKPEAGAPSEFVPSSEATPLADEADAPTEFLPPKRITPQMNADAKSSDWRPVPTAEGSADEEATDEPASDTEPTATPEIDATPKAEAQPASEAETEAEEELNPFEVREDQQEEALELLTMRPIKKRR